MKKSSIGVIFAILVLSVIFSSCATEKPLYTWGNYETQAYSHLKGESRITQLEILEADYKLIASKEEAFPPGFFAHMGLLYLEAGNTGDAVTCFEKEKELFPEGTPFMDYLLKGLRR